MVSSKVFIVAATLLFGVAQPAAITQTVYTCDTDASYTSTYIPEETDPSDSSIYALSAETGGSYTSTYAHSATPTPTPSYIHIFSNQTLSEKASPTAASASATSSIDPQCTNGPDSRHCWENGYDIDTDLDIHWPQTGKVVKYDLEVVNTTLAVDGISRPVLVVNGQFPGPVITADWGDILEITVKNKMKDNGTSMHWHGLRQLFSTTMDGANGITECPIAPGEEKTYTFLCTQHGTSWYHSHFSVQYTDGVVGPIVINGPATANYDIDLGAFPITDWYHEGATALSIQSQLGNGPAPQAPNGLINGTMLSPDGTQGAYNKATLEKGKKYRLRLINTSTDNHFKVSLDGHAFTVITSDFTPITPYSTEWLFLAIGQRYDVIITADQDISSYWFRAEVQSLCGDNANNGNIRSIFTYDGAEDGLPTTEAPAYTPSCLDESTIVPRVAKSVPSTDFLAQAADLDVAFGGAVNTNGQNIVTWSINGTTLHIDWAAPTLQLVRDAAAGTEPVFPSSLNVISLPDANRWYYWVIQAVGGLSVPHPIHLHGHDFSVLGSGTGLWDPAFAADLNFDNPIRRDVAMLPSLGPTVAASGWLVVAFQTDNPGAWLMHCHIAWHVSEGLAVQFLEREDEIASSVDLTNLDKTCPAWKKYASEGQMYFPQSDSGLRRM